jgi:inner membrane protein
MMALTHAVISTAGISLILTTNDPLHLALAIAGSQLPDIDTSTSTIGQILLPISSWIENRYPHRSITHSLIATVTIAILSLPLYFHFGWKTWSCLPLGHLISCFSDVFTKQGVQLFWPNSVWCISVSNPNRRLKTGGNGEYWVLAVSTAVLIAAINLSHTGGPTALVGTSLGLRSTTVETYQKNSTNNHIYAEFVGTYTADSSKADGKYFIVAADGNEFVLFKNNQVYKTGVNIIASRLTSTVGDVGTSLVQSLQFDDEPFSIAPVQNTLIFINGELTVDDSDLIKIPANPKQFQITKLTGDKITFNYCPLENAIALLKDQVVSGSLEAKIFSPKPKL